MSDNVDTFYMRHALKEARKGLGRTSPNPCVGAIIVKNDMIIARGYHQKAGTAHAEIHALHRAGAEAAGAVMYVTLEPCNHTGRTPPCSHAVAARGIKKVVIGMRDPNPLVDGSGAHYLRNAGIEVVSGILEDECRELNRPFLKYITSSLPFVVLKAGLSLDGKIAYTKGCGGQVSGAESARQVHRLRNTMDAILVGIGTVAADDPALTTRLAGATGRDPVRIILDTGLNIARSAKIVELRSEAPTWIFCGMGADPAKAAQLVACGVELFPTATNRQGHVDLQEVVKVLGARHITSVLVEGGAEIHGAFLNAQLADRVHLFYAPIFIGDEGTSVICGHRAHTKDQAVRLINVRVRRHGEDVSLQGDIVYP